MNKSVRWLLLAAALLTSIFVVVFLLQEDERLAILTRNTLKLSLGTCAISLPIGVVLAWVVFRTDAPGREWLRVLLGAVLLFPLYLQATAWHAGFGQLGWFSLVRNELATPLLNGMQGAIWVHAMAAIPWVVLIVGAGLRAVEPELEEEAWLQGSAAQVLFFVTLPRTKAAIGVAALWVLLFTAGEMTASDLYRVRTYAEELYSGFALADSPMQVFWTVLPMILVVAVLVLAAWQVIARVAPSGGFATLKRSFTFQLGGCRWVATGFAVLAAMLVVGVPLFNLVYKAGVVAEQVDGQRVRHWSAAKFAEIVGGAPGKYQEEFGWTLLIGSVTALVAIVVAVPLAWYARGGGKKALPAMGLSVVGLALPGPLLAIMTIWLLDWNWEPLIWLYDRTLAAPVFVLFIRVVPMTILICWYALRSLPEETLDSAATEGASAAARLWRIATPQRLTAIVAAWIATFALAAGDLTASILVLPAGVDTVPRRVFGLVHQGVDYQVAGICLTTIAAYCLIAGVVVWLLRLSGRRE